MSDCLTDLATHRATVFEAVFHFSGLLKPSVVFPEYRAYVHSIMENESNPQAVWLRRIYNVYTYNGEVEDRDLPDGLFFIMLDWFRNGAHPTREERAVVAKKLASKDLIRAVLLESIGPYRSRGVWTFEESRAAERRLIGLRSFVSRTARDMHEGVNSAKLYSIFLLQNEAWRVQSYIWYYRKNVTMCQKWDCASEEHFEEFLDARRGGSHIIISASAILAFADPVIQYAQSINAQQVANDAYNFNEG